jgi:hypothetical protein
MTIWSLGSPEAKGGGSVRVVKQSTLPLPWQRVRGFGLADS